MSRAGSRLYVAIGSQPEIVATSANISEVGIALTNAPGLQVGDRVTLRLLLPHTQADAKITAEVCWCNPAGAQAWNSFRSPPPSRSSWSPGWPPASKTISAKKPPH